MVDNPFHYGEIKLERSLYIDTFIARVEPRGARSGTHDCSSMTGVIGAVLPRGDDN